MELEISSLSDSTWLQLIILIYTVGIVFLLYTPFSFI